jgi:UDPglucose--hexose-1-phosphate uridylyltransferase
MVLEFREDPTKNVRVVISSERAKRPSMTGEKPKAPPACPFCRGNESMTPQATFALPLEPNWKVRCFRNKFAVMKPEGKYSEKGLGRDILWTSPAWGDHEVIVETNDHNKLFQDFTPKEFHYILEAYKNRFRELGKRPGVKAVYLFKNHGRASGASIQHEHSQIIALPFVPDVLKKEAQAIARHKKKTGKCIFCELIRKEHGAKNVIRENDSFIAFCPYFSRFPDEFWIASKRHARSFLEFTEKETEDFIKMLHISIHRAYEESTDYTIAYHNAPGESDFHFHIEVYPRPNVWGGIEIGTGLIVNIKSPNQAVKELRHPGPG